MRSPRCSSPLCRQHFPGIADARIANWRATDRGLSTETFLFDLYRRKVTTGQRRWNSWCFGGPRTSLYPDYDLTRQVMVMNRLRDTPIAVPTVCWLDRDDEDSARRTT